MSQRTIIKELTATNIKLQEVIADLRLEIVQLKQELASYKTGKDSSNSHKPPSSDFQTPIRNQSLREKTGKKPGGQFGHKGTTLQMSEQPDKIIKHSPCVCEQCGRLLNPANEQFIEKRQIVDIPPIKAIHTEHQTYCKTCTCGHTTKSSFPKDITSTIQYGSNVEAWIAYLHARQYLPYNRMKEFFNDVIGFSISEGGIQHILQRFTGKAMPRYEQIRILIQEAESAGTDETGAKVNKEKHWFWTWQNETLTYIIHAVSRGFITISETFPNGLPNTILNHDRLAAHFKCNAKDHQACTAHLLRDLNYIEELHQSKWAKDFKVLIQKALDLKSKMSLLAYSQPNIARDELEIQLTNILVESLPSQDEKAITFQKQMRKIQQHIFVFLYHPKVPPDNNGSERAIRNIKVKQKISGQFKSIEGAQSFAVLRSIIDTANKKGEKVYDVLFDIAKLRTG